MNTLCFASNLTSAEWAAWVQAVGSILAILGAAGTAVWLARKQHNNALALHVAGQRHARSEIAKTLSILAQNCSKAMVFLTGQVTDRESVHNAAEGCVHFDLGELARLDSAMAAIPLQTLPSTLVTPMMILSGTVRQFREKIEIVFRTHRTMDAAAFDDFFRVIGEMNESSKLTCAHIAKEVDRV